jgi:two-component system, OmpR family, heavy metal sensor histidine kinase CusS
VIPLSIRLQLSLMVSVLTLLIIVVLSSVAYVEFEESLLRNMDATLRAVAEGIRVELVEEEGLAAHEAELRAITGHGMPEYSSQCRIWMEANPEDIFATGEGNAPVSQGLLLPPPEKRPEVGSFTLFNLAGGEGSGRKGMLRAMWMRHALPQGIVNILVARSSKYAYHELGEFLRLLLVFGGSVTLAVLLVVPGIVSWGLRAITRAGRQLGQITYRSLEHADRIMGNVPSELGPFQSALDGMLMRLNAAIRQQEQFTADAAHELRTPLAIMKSTLQTLRIRPRTSVEHEQAEDDVLEDVDRMEQLVGQLLVLARLDATEMVPNPVEVRLDTLLESLAEVFDDRACQQGASVVYAGDGAVSIEGDETELRRLFSNLLDNALRYGPPRGTIHLTLQNELGPRATVCVHDEGGGIPPEKLPHLFDRFYRVDPSRSQPSGGTGLGLAIARGIVLRHHGEITITSDPQAGTSVVVRLPRM